MKAIPGYEECEEGAREFGAIVKGKILNSFDSLSKTADVWLNFDVDKKFPCRRLIEFDVDKNFSIKHLAKTIKLSSCFSFFRTVDFSNWTVSFSSLSRAWRDRQWVKGSFTNFHAMCFGSKGKSTENSQKESFPRRSWLSALENAFSSNVFAG